jgi:protein-disulfide isomerase
MPPKVEVTAEDHVQGRPDARVTLIEYGDYECPHCGQAYWTIKDLQEQFGNDLSFVYRNFPLTQIHPMAEPAAESAEFAAANGRFWEMHDAIYENQESLSLEMLRQLAEGLSLNEADLQQSLERHQFLPRIKHEFMTGVRAGVNGTPTFFINGARFDGSAEDLGAAITEELRSRAA